MKKNKIFYLFIFILSFILLFSVNANELEEIDNKTTYTIGDEFSVNTNELEEIDEEDVKQNIERLKIKDVRAINKANTVVIKALNKITAKTYTYEIQVGKSIEFERLIIKPLFCWKSSPSQVQENKALFEIEEIKLNGIKEKLFYGWMFSANPSVSSIQHSMYDIILVNCKK